MLVAASSSVDVGAQTRQDAVIYSHGGALAAVDDVVAAAEHTCHRRLSAKIRRIDIGQRRVAYFQVD